MPKSALKPCAKAGCGKLVDRKDRFCTAHGGNTNWQQYQAKQTKEQRGRTSTAKWKKFRKRRLAESNYLCAECLRDGIHKPGNELDHIVPIAHGGAEYDDNNTQVLCKTHHRSKTAKERINK